MIRTTLGISRGGAGWRAIEDGLFTPRRVMNEPGIAKKVLLSKLKEQPLD